MQDAPRSSLEGGGDSPAKGVGLLSLGLVASAAALAALGVDQSVYLTVAALDVRADLLL